MACSSSRASNTRPTPNRRTSPRVTPYTPPLRPTSCRTRSAPGRRRRVGSRGRWCPPGSAARPPLAACAEAPARAAAARPGPPGAPPGRGAAARAGRLPRRLASGGASWPRRRGAAPGPQRLVPPVTCSGSRSRPPRSAAWSRAAVAGVLRRDLGRAAVADLRVAARVAQETHDLQRKNVGERLAGRRPRPPRRRRAGRGVAAVRAEGAQRGPSGTRSRDPAVRAGYADPEGRRPRRPAGAASAC